jgi:hypothetical protein
VKSKADSKQNRDIEIIDLTPQNIENYGVCGYRDAGKHIELKRKICWFKEHYPKGLRIKALMSEAGGYQGMLEYIPGKYAHRPVEAEGYMFIHCLFVGFRNEFKGKGYATLMIKRCIDESKAANMSGVAVVTRKGPFMAKPDIFLKNGFAVVDKAEPDFELLVLKFGRTAADPKFRNMAATEYQDGLTIIRSPQCPYSEKNVNAILQTAKTMKMKTTLIDLKDSSSAQKAPCPFGTFCVILNGEIISHHPISDTRFRNILSQ